MCPALSLVPTLRLKYRKEKTMKKGYQIIAIILCICLVAGLFSQWAFAADKEIDVGSNDSFEEIREIANKG